MAEKTSTPMDGKGRELTDLLMEHLGIQKAGCTGFEVRFQVGEPITVTVRRFVTESGLTDAIDVTTLTNDTRVFRLVECDPDDSGGQIG